MNWRKLLADRYARSWVPLYLLARLRGAGYQLRYRRHPRVHIGAGFAAEGPLCISGPGSVHIGRGVKIRCSNTYPVTIRTLSPEARVVIGDGTDMGGVQILCRREVSLGENTMAANCRIQDVDFLSDERDASPRRIRTGKGVWIGLTAMVLKGATLGDWAIVAAGSVVERRVERQALAMGNPARPIRGVVS